MLTFILVIAFLAAWIALYVLVIRPKLVAFRYTAGIYAKIDVAEAAGRSKIMLWLKGAKVAIIGFVVSSSPVLAVLYGQISGLDWSQFVSSEKAKILGIVVTVLGVFGPMLMTFLHQGAIAEASAAAPVDVPPVVTPAPAK